MDSAQWTQEFGVAKSMAAEIVGPNACSKAERKVRPGKDEAVNCPRCHSTNTKFCYYNNYSLTQPRYFCKTCRRYWTEGGTLRNVPVGGGSRKNKRSMITPSPLPSHNKLPDLNPFSSQNPKIHDQGHHLNLGFHGVPQFLEFPKMEGRDHAINSASNSANTTTSSSAPPLSALNFFRDGIAAGRGLNSFFPMAMGTSALDFASNFPFQECKPALSFPIEDVGGSRYDSSNATHQDNNNVHGSLVFTLGGATRRNPNVDVDQDKGQENSNGFWNGMLGGGSW